MKKNDRKEKILDGVIKLIASRGLEGVTHRAVDQFVGLPQGSTTYYFPKKAALIIAAAEQLADHLAKDCDELQVGFAACAAKQGMEAAITYVGEYLVSYADNSRHLFLARMELTVASTRREEFAHLGELLTVAARRPIEFFLEL
ncbi:MAG: TetR family transcriptional regulator, partial [Rhizobiales bacterium]|nr:TetR family transcriptional regulator [Hyphomicrobiales bacterium]